MLLAKGMEGSEEIAAGGAQRGEFLAQAEAVAFAEAGDQGILGGEIAIEIAGLMPASAATSCIVAR